MLNPADISVVPTTVFSPLHAELVANSLDKSHIGVLSQHEAPMPLLEYQSRRGFAGVPEKFLRKALETNGAAVPEPEHGLDFECQLSFALTSQLLPGSSTADVKKFMSKRLEISLPDCDESGVLEAIGQSDLLADVVGRS